MLHIKLKGMTNAVTCKQIFCPYTHPGLWVETFFPESSHVAYQIKEHHESTYFPYIHSTTDGVKRSTKISDSSHIAYQIKGNGA